MFNKEKICSSRSFFEEINAICLQKLPQIQTKIDNISKKFQSFKDFEQFLSFFGKIWWLRMVKTFNKRKFVVREAFVKKQMQFLMKKGSNCDRNDKNSKDFMNQIVENHQPTTNEFVVC